MPEEFAPLEVEKEENFLSVCLSVFISSPSFLPSFLLFLQFLIVCSVCVHHEEGRIKEEAALGRVMS